jgi:uncharacterized RDD family membrane protein YckC
VDSWGVPVAPTFVLAGRGTRLVAFLLNTVLWIAPVVLGSLAAPEAWDDPQQVRDPVTGELVQAHERATLIFGGIMLGGWLLVLIVNAVLVGTRSQSIGKLLVGIEIRREDGSHAGFWRIVGLRWLVSAAIGATVPFYSLVNPAFIFRRDRRCVHDLIADTIVVVRGGGTGAVADSLPAPQLSEAVPPSQRCPTCRAGAPADAVYCASCGNRLDAVPVAPGGGPPTPPDEETFQW